MDSILTIVMTWSGVIAAGILFFDRVAKMTKNTTDDTIMGYVHKVASLLSIRASENS